MAIAIRSGRKSGRTPPTLNWDLEVSFGRWGVPLPDCIEDALLTKVGLLLLRSFNRVNLIDLDFNALAAHEEALEKMLDAADGENAAS